MNIRHFSAQLDIVCTRLGVVHSSSGVSRCCWGSRSATLPLSLHHRSQTAGVCIQGSGKTVGFRYQRLNRNWYSSSLCIDRACVCCRLDAGKSVGGRQWYSSSVKCQWYSCSAVCSPRQIGEWNDYVECVYLLVYCIPSIVVVSIKM